MADRAARQNDRKNKWAVPGSAHDRLVRLSKIALVAAVALFFTLVAFGNITDYNSDWQFVQHVLSMDTTFPDSSLHWRAITDPTIQTAGYWLIIATEIVIAILLWAGALRLLGSIARSAGTFWFVVFIVAIVVMIVLGAPFEAIYSLVPMAFALASYFWQRVNGAATFRAATSPDGTTTPSFSSRTRSAKWSPSVTTIGSSAHR